MSTDYVDNLTDIQLYRELVRNGFPNTPVTETTRRILIKKLKLHLKKETKQSINNRNKRLTEPSNNTTSSYSQNGNVSEKSSTSSSTYLLRSSDVAKPQTIKPRAKLYSTDNNNGALTTNSMSNRPYFENIEPPITTTYSSSHHSTPRMYAPPPILASESESDNDTILYNKYRKMCAMNYPIDSSKYDHPSNGVVGGMMNIENASDGGVVSRLLSLRGSTLQQKKPKNKVSYIDNKFLKSARGNRSLKSLYTKLVTHIKSKQDLSHLIIPYILIGALVTFLMVITFLYLSRRYSQGLIDENTTKYKLCGGDSHNIPARRIDFDSTSVSPCIDGELLQGALNVNKQLVELLEERARSHHCVDRNQSPLVNLRDIFQRLRQNDKHLRIETLSQELYAVIYLITQNPQWNIDVFNAQGDSVRSQEITTISLENITFALLKPSLPLKCIIYNKAQRFFFILGLLSVVGLVVGILYFGVRYYKAHKRDKLIAAEQFAKDIVNELIFQSSQAENRQSTDIIIDHLRDKLIPSNKRRQFLWSWNEAIRKLEEHDNRVMFGIVMRNGQEMRTLSWNEMNSSELDFSSKKKWQSPAFDNTNKIANPPTPCLKIRHMFDSSEVNHPALRQLIVDAIFEKVGTHCKICDIQLDKQSCCVYLRCATEMDAGIVHNEINGWWFDNRLISIKFLRLERYMSRFPKSSNQPMRFISPNFSNVHQRS